ncbi:MAG: DUF3576 domain-containing protein [Azospirillum sp.]|nr:DUF3576 domain-containing protein [Azospirillum sp.]
MTVFGRCCGVLWFATLPVLLAACGPQTPTPNPKEGEEYKNGSILGGEGGLQILGPARRQEAEQGGGGIGVNSFLWRASLDTLSFMPIASADPFGGVILTDWYSPAGAPGERFKVNVYILDRQLRANGLKVSVFRQIRDNSGQWRDDATGADTAIKMEDTILTRARQLRIAQTSSEK